MDVFTASAWRRLRAEAARYACLSYERERELMTLAQSGDRGALAELVTSHLRLVVEVASHYQRAALQPSDLVSEGCVGLIEAIQRFDMAESARLSGYARWWIRSRVRAYAVANRNLVEPPTTRNGRVAYARLALTERRLSQELGRAPLRAELAAAMHIEESDVAAALGPPDLSLSHDGLRSVPFEPQDERPTPEAWVDERERERLRSTYVRSAVAKLRARDREIVRAHFLSDEEVSLAELGQELGVSRQRISQIVSRVSKQLRRELRSLAG